MSSYVYPLIYVTIGRPLAAEAEAVWPRIPTRWVEWLSHGYVSSLQRPRSSSGSMPLHADGCGAADGNIPARGLEGTLQEAKFSILQVTSAFKTMPPKQQRQVLRGGREREIRSQHSIREHYLASDECCKFTHLDATHPDREGLREITHRAREALSGCDNSLAQQKSTWNFFQKWCEERDVAPTATLDTAVKYLDFEASEGRYSEDNNKSANKVSSLGCSGLSG